MDFHEFSKILEFLKKGSDQSLVHHDLEIFSVFLLASIFYPNYAISSKSYRFLEFHN